MEGAAKQSQAKHCLLRAGPTAGQQQGPPCRAAKMPCVSFRSFFAQSSVVVPNILRRTSLPPPSEGFAVEEWSTGASMTEHHEWSRHTGLHTNSHTRPITDIIVARPSIFADRNLSDLGSRAGSAVGTELSTVTTVCRIVRRLL